MQISNVLITSSAHKVQVLNSVETALLKLNKESRVICGDINSNVLTKYLAQDFWQMPKLEDLSERQILSECERLGVNCIIPTRDGELVYWAKRKKFLRKHGIRVLVPDVSSVRIAIDKIQFEKWCNMNGFECIKSIDILPEANFESADKYVIKERFGSGSQKVVKDVSMQCVMKALSKFDAPLVQRCVHGTEVSCDAWLSNDLKTSRVMLRSRDVVVDGESKVSTIFSDGPLESLITRFITALKLTGLSVVQGFLTGDTFMLMEANTRVGGGTSMSIAAGLDAFTWMFQDNFASYQSDFNFVRPTTNVQVARVTIDRIIE